MVPTEDDRTGRLRILNRSINRLLGAAGVFALLLVGIFGWRIDQLVADAGRVARLDRAIADADQVQVILMSVDARIRAYLGSRSVLSLENVFVAGRKLHSRLVELETLAASDGSAPAVLALEARRAAERLQARLPELPEAPAPTTRPGSYIRAGGFDPRVLWDAMNESRELLLQFVREEERLRESKGAVLKQSEAVIFGLLLAAVCFFGAAFVRFGRGRLLELFRAQERILAVERERNRLELQLKLFTDAMPQLAWSASARGNLEYWNEGWFRYTGASKARSLGPRVLAYLHPEQRRPVLERWRGCMRDRTPFEAELLLKNRRGEYRWHLSRCIPVFDERSRVTRWLGTLTDIEGQKRVMLDLEEERKLRERFVATLSHDLRTPLTVAQMCSDMVLRQRELGPEPRELVSRILDGLGRMEQMITDMLDANRIHAGRPVALEAERADLGQLVQVSVSEMGLIHGNGRFRLDLQGDLRAEFDAKSLRRVMENLCGNAVKYGAPGAEVAVGAFDRGDHVELSVHNFGTPIPRQELGDLFTPFHRASSAVASRKKGWGIGLTLVQGVVRAHGGRIEVESAEEIGTTFRVLLPRAPMVGPATGRGTA